MEKKFLITSLSKKGFGRAIEENSQVKTILEVPHSLPGDEITAFLYKKRKGKRKGRLLSIDKPSTSRNEPTCPHAFICGGCTLHCLAYEKQLEEKQKRVLNLFQDYFIQRPFELFPISPAKQQWEYRNKMEFNFSENKAGTKFLGLMIASANRFVFNITKCHLASVWFSEIVDLVRGWWEKTGLSAYNGITNEGHLRSLTLREGKNTGDKMIILTVSGNPDYRIDPLLLNDLVKKLTDHLGKDKLSIYLRVWTCQKGTPSTIQDSLLFGMENIYETMSIAYQNQIKTMRFAIGPSSFFQPNTHQAEKIYNQAIAFATPSQTDIVYDLYAGVGSIGMAFSYFVKKVIAIELNAEAIEDAKKNCAQNHITNMQAIAGDVKQILQDIRNQSGEITADIVIVDPPRAGLMADAIDQIALLNPSKIIYISCNPETQKLDAEQLFEKGYAIQKMMPVDQFSQTMHIENIALLTKI